MKNYYDFHIHTALSPCGQEWMSPNNILNMAYLKELDSIAICDHNSVKQLINFDYLKTSYEMVIIPGVEVTVKEGYHIICLFYNFFSAYEFGNVLLENMNIISHDEKKLGEQIIFDYYDEISIKNNEITLHQNTLLSVKKLKEIVNEYSGIMILAHIERYNNIYDDIDTLYSGMFDAIEINAISNYDDILKKHKNLKNYKIVRNSDAHSLEIINEKKFYLEISKKTIKEVLNYLGAKNE